MKWNIELQKNNETKIYYFIHWKLLFKSRRGSKWNLNTGRTDTFTSAIFDLNTVLTASMKQAWKWRIYFPSINLQVVIREGKYGFQATEAL